jgi:hypothetical protein
MRDFIALEIADRCDICARFDWGAIGDDGVSGVFEYSISRHREQAHSYS